MPEFRQLKLGVIATADADFRRCVQLAQRAEQAKLDLIVFAEGAAVTLEPTALLAGLAAVTTQIGLIATASTIYNEPYNLARRFASLDHISGGRIGWNLAAAPLADAANYGFDGPPDADARLARAAEFYDVVAGLWDSWEDGALLRDKTSGDYIDRDKIHFLDHAGAHFKVKGPLNITRSAQGWPVVTLAAMSDAERALAARAADVVFTAETELGAAQAFYADLKGRAAHHGRAPDDLTIMAALPAPSADALATWLDAAAADGFAVEATQLNDVTRGVIPELQRRGIFRTDYTGTTLRQHLGLRVPENRYTRERAAARG
ncbi:MAG: LLM class flavin-dependent oxidoreductase [Proteobacteria bacterium]|nr:LLM class flavin-dependent oxidoreductase [Pseudomonadota bacterium]